MVACEDMVGLSNIFLMDNITKKKLDGPFVDELGTSTGPWPRYLVMTSTDGGKITVDFHLLQFTRVLLGLIFI